MSDSTTTNERSNTERVHNDQIGQTKQYVAFIDEK